MAAFLTGATSTGLPALGPAGGSGSGSCFMPGQVKLFLSLINLIKTELFRVTCGWETMGHVFGRLGARAVASLRNLQNHLPTAMQTHPGWLLLTSQNSGRCHAQTRKGARGQALGGWGPARPPAQDAGREKGVGRLLTLGGLPPQEGQGLIPSHMVKTAAETGYLHRVEGGQLLTQVLAQDLLPGWQEGQGGRCWAGSEALADGDGWGTRAAMPQLPALGWEASPATMLPDQEPCAPAPGWALPGRAWACVVC